MSLLFCTLRDNAIRKLLPTLPGMARVGMRGGFAPRDRERTGLPSHCVLGVPLRGELRFACSGTHGITFALRARCSLEGEASLRVTGNARDHARDYLRSA